MLTLQQIDRFFNLAQVILFLGIIGIFFGYYINSPLLMNISLGIELFVGFLFLVPLMTGVLQAQIQVAIILAHYHLTKSTVEKPEE